MLKPKPEALSQKLQNAGSHPGRTGPDHIATLVSFSTLLTPWAAAKVGAAWGVGHCAGILGVALLV